MNIDRVLHGLKMMRDNRELDIQEAGDTEEQDRYQRDLDVLTDAIEYIWQYQDLRH